MSIYILLLSITVLLGITMPKKIVVDNNISVIKNNKLYTVIISAAMILVSSLRDISVGTDTPAYYRQFNYVKNVDLKTALSMIEREYGYRLLEFFSGKIFSEFQFFLFIIAIVYISSVSKLIFKNSKSQVLSYILFIGLGFFTFGMSAIRQTLAISIILISFESIKNRELKKYLLYIFIAISFHITAIIFLPVYWFKDFKINYKNIGSIVIFSSLVYAFKDRIINILINIYPIEYYSMDTGGNRFYIMLLFSVLLGFLYRKSFINNNSTNRILFIIIVASVVIFPITQFHPAMMRLYWYFSIFLIVYIPNLLMSIKDRMIRLIGIYGYIGLSVIYFFTNTINTLNLKNYIFFW